MNNSRETDIASEGVSSSVGAVLLILRADCSLLALKPARSSSKLPGPECTHAQGAGRDCSQNTLSQIVFAMLDQKNYAEAICKLLYPQAARPFKIDEDE